LQDWTDDEDEVKAQVLEAVRPALEAGQADTGQDVVTHHYMSGIKCL